MKKFGFVLVVLYMFVFMPAHAYAYIDPGTGSMIIQVVSAAVLGGIVFIKIYWNKLMVLFTKKKKSYQNKDQ